jgi:transcriptional regulator with XRE-family HTH domain
MMEKCTLIGLRGEHMASQTSFGETLREARVKKGVSLRSLASELSITPSYLSDIENDRRIPSEDVLQQLATLLDLNFDDLMAQAGRLGEEAERYLKHQPTAVKLFRRISESNLGEEDLKKLLRAVDDVRKE